MSTRAWRKTCCRVAAWWSESKHLIVIWSILFHRRSRLSFSRCLQSRPIVPKAKMNLHTGDDMSKDQVCSAKNGLSAIEWQWASTVLLHTPMIQVYSPFILAWLKSPYASICLSWHTILSPCIILLCQWHTNNLDLARKKPFRLKNVLWFMYASTPQKSITKPWMRIIFDGDAWFPRIELMNRSVLTDTFHPDLFLHAKPIASTDVSVVWMTGHNHETETSMNEGIDFPRRL